MIHEISKFKNAIRVLKMVRNELEQTGQENIETLDDHDKRVLRKELVLPLKKSQVNKCEKIAAHYGRDTQEFQSISELFELGEVLSRRPGQRGQTWKGKLLDEMADVTIMIQQLRLLYDISDDDFDEKVTEKLNRQLERIKNRG